nr:hypothetical protein DA06_13940 [Georgenia sp. SUBG003]
MVMQPAGPAGMVVLTAPADGTAVSVAVGTSVSVAVGAAVSVAGARAGPCPCWPPALPARLARAAGDGRRCPRRLRRLPEEVAEVGSARG